MDPVQKEPISRGEDGTEAFAFGGHSAMGVALRKFDWASTSLGPISGWPQSLKVAVGICLNSRFPMFVWWGPDLINIYNDAYVPVLGKRHPEAFGRPARQSWEEIWPTVGPQAEAVMTQGEATWNQRVLLVMERNDYTEETWFTWSYSPIPDGEGGIGGVFCACVEETQRVQTERERDQLVEQLAAERASLGEVFAQSPAFVAVLRGPDHVFEFVNERYTELVGGRQILGKTVAEALPEVRQQGFLALLDQVYASGEPYIGSGTTIVLQNAVDPSENERRVDFVYQPLRNPAGEVTGILAHGVDVTQRLRNEEAVRVLAEKYERQSRLFEGLASTTPDFFFVFDRDGRVRYANRRLLEVWGRSFDEAVGRQLAELGYPDWHARKHHDEMAQVIETKRPITGEVGFTGASGISGIYEYIFAPVVGPDGEVEAIAGTTRDVTERKRIEEEIQERERRLRALVDQSAAGIAQTDLEGHLLFVNKRFCELVDYSAEELLGKRVHDLTHPDDLAQTSQLVAQASAAGQEYAMEKRYIRKDGAVIWVAVSAGILKDELGRPYAIMGVVVDISDRKRAQEALRDQEKRHAASLLAAMDCVISMDHEGTVIEWNPAAEQTFGYRRDEAVGKLLGELIIPRSAHEGHQLGLQRYLQSGSDRLIGKRMEVTATRRDGAEFPVELAVTRLPTSGPPIFTAYLRDISERRAAEDELRRAKEAAERASEAKSEFLATLSHELRTPLTPVMLTVSLMESHPALPEVLREDVAMIRRNVELESRLISDLLDLTRIANGKLQLDVQVVDLHLVIRSAIDICQREASARLVVELAAAQHNVEGDSTRLQQIFWNLINNAIKFTGPDGTIQVRSSDAGEDRIRVEVSDTGVGIDPLVLPRLFAAFEQGEVRAGRQQAGLGLGLAISRRLVEMHGGTISAASQGRGHGSTFSVELPVVEIFPERPASGHKPVAVPGAIEPLKVLLVEDHEPTLTVMSKLLRRLGHTVTQATSVASARAAASQETFDLIISDLGLPDGSGLDVMRHLRDQFKGRAIALTGYGTESDIAASHAAGFAEHLTKPVDMAALQEVIHRVTR